ncbi:MAG: HD domain-containing protein [Clostridia bacterium]|nr:HD domain-containing protein [Clostridia bacterium]
MISIPPNVHYIMKLLEESGFESFVVGGCVRDSLMGRTPSDWDVCTDCVPERMKQVFSGLKTVDIGEKHGTVAVVLGSEKIEVTTYRVDGVYLDHRHPLRASFTSRLGDDLSRRDFTINAMAYSPRSGLVDLFGGAEDIRRGLIRAVGEPAKRFDEDALRILRAVRFSAALGFGIEKNTASAARQKRELLDFVSAERRCAELRKTVAAPFAARALSENEDIFFALVPEMSPCRGFDQRSRYHVYDVWEHILRTLDAAEGGDEVLRLAALFHDIAKPERARTGGDGCLHFPGHPKRGAEITRDVFTRLKFDRKTTDAVCALIEDHDCYLKPDEKQLAGLLRRHGPEQMERLFALQKADMLAHAPFVIESFSVELDAAHALFETMLERSAPVTVSALKINGGDVMRALGIPPGPAVGGVLEELLDLVTSHRLENTREALLAELEKRSSAGQPQ